MSVGLLHAVKRLNLIWLCDNFIHSFSKIPREKVHLTQKKKEKKNTENLVASDEWKFRK